MPHSDGHRCAASEKNCGQNANSTAVMRAPQAPRSPRARRWRSPISCAWTTAFPSTRVTSTVDAVPMADSAMVMMLSICSALPTAAAGSVPSGASMHLVHVAYHDLHEQLHEQRDGQHEHVGRLRSSRPVRASAGPPRIPGTRVARSVRSPRLPVRDRVPLGPTAVIDMGFSAPLSYEAPAFQRTSFTFTRRAVYGTSTPA